MVQAYLCVEINIYLCIAVINAIRLLNLLFYDNYMKTRYILPSRISSLAKLDHLLHTEKFVGAKKFIIVDENTYTHCLPQLIGRVSALEEAEFFEVPVGEEAKSLEIAAQLWGVLMDRGADRNSLILNLGGGCVSDIGGFVAAGFKRGIRYINIPTSLIGMVDAAIGGKTAVNVNNVKNQVGFFHQPEAVCIYPLFLNTLPEVDLKCGVFEMAKTLLLIDAQAFEKLISVVNGCSRFPMNDITAFVSQCVDFKSSVVAADPKELSVRKILNFGHTFGHAIESFMMDRGLPMPHGAAVGVGMKCELYLSVKKIGMSIKVYEDFCRMLHHLVTVPKFSLRDTEGILSYMRQDKKNQDNLILCVLLQTLGVPVIDVALNENEIRDALLHT